MTRPTSRAATRPRRTAVTVAGASALVVVLAACGAGFGAQTNQVRVPGDGVPASVGSLRVLNALVVSRGPDATVSMTLANTANAAVATTDQSANAVSLAGISSGSTAATIAGPTTVNAAAALHVGAGETTATFSGTTFTPGTYVALTVTVQPSQTVTLTVPVVAATGYFATLLPTPAAG